MLKPGDAIGILGGGQLARMLALAAAPLGLDIHIFCPEPDSPAFRVAAGHVIASYSDEKALAEFAAQVSVVTYEFENVPAATAAFLAQRVPVLPGPRALAITQDRLSEKNFINEIGLATPGYLPVDDADMLVEAVAALGRPSVLKTRRMGYDGKGQAMIRPGTDLAEAWQSIGRQPAILEAFVPFEREISVLVARGQDGTVAAFDVCENVHRHHILASTLVPAALGPAASHVAIEHAARIATRLDYVGVLAVELFVGTDGSLLVNEIAPRVHNTGHWTLEACACSQFEQHIRAVAGWPLGASHRHADAVMENIIGAEADAWQALAKTGALNLYGKKQARPGRKMGHITRLKGQKGNKP